jgi:hypothetical protein
MQQAGVDAVLIGESLMRSHDPEVALRALRAGAEGGIDHANSSRP